MKLWIFGLGVFFACAPNSHPLRVGSKKFTESVIVAEILTQLARSEGVQTVHQKELGGTRLLYEALVSGNIDAYPEYTGTLFMEIFPGIPKTEASLTEALGKKGIRITSALGFNNTYAIGMREEVAERAKVQTLSELAGHPEIRLGLSNEFMQRADGWPSVKTAYGLQPTDLRGMDHDLAYRALESGQVDATDLYSTDAEIAALGLRVLVDDLRHFPEYHAVVLYREALERTTLPAINAWKSLAGLIDAPRMTEMNAKSKLEHVPEPRIASEFLRQHLKRGVSVTEEESPSQRLVRTTWEHLALVGLSWSMAVLIGIVLGIISARWETLGQGVLAVVGLLQTVPSLALLVFMIPLLGIGAQPAVAALFLYALLPIVRGTHAGLVHIDSGLKDAALALALPRRAVLWRIELPLAMPSILAGAQTAAVITIGTATLGALVGAGGYGQSILTGIRLANTRLILEGAIPAALLAVVTHGVFLLLEKVMVPRGLRLQRGR